VGQANNFDALRLGAALLVVESHSFAMTASGSDSVTRFFPDLDGGEIAVATFFVISGYLITISAQRRSRLEFLLARGLRILPALIFVTLFSVLVIGPIFTRMPLHVYATSPITLNYLGNAYVFGLSFFLPGVFTSSPVPGVNGSLWTLPLEVSMYALVALLTIFWIGKKRVSMLVSGVFVAGFAMATLRYNLWWNQRGPAIFPNVELYPFLRYGHPRDRGPRCGTAGQSDDLYPRS
jgi:peptidoglycan/LPS O-acetylase OafA/YrhL